MSNVERRTSNEKDNVLVWDGKKKGHYEVYYLKFNQPKTQSAWWIRYTLLSPVSGKGEPVAELWGIYFDGKDFKRNAAFKKSFPFAEAQVDSSPFRYRISDAVLTHDSAWGRLEGNGRKMEWDLKMKATADTFRHFPYAAMYGGKLPKTKVLSPHINSRFTGTVKVDGRAFELKDEPGQQTHIWGTKHAYRWAWGHCNLFKEDPGAVLELLSGQIKVGPVKAPVMSVFHLVHKGAACTVNKLGASIRPKTKWEIGSWDFEVEADGRKFAVSMRSPIENFVGVEYTDPDGEKAWCFNTKIADCRVKIFESASVGRGWTQSGELTSEGGCAFEIAQRQKDPRIAIRI